MSWKTTYLADLTALADGTYVLEFQREGLRLTSLIMRDLWAMSNGHWSERWELVVGLEVHAQLIAESKAYPATPTPMATTRTRT